MMVKKPILKKFIRLYEKLLVTDRIKVGGVAYRRLNELKLRYSSVDDQSTKD